jgi:hypothetical protein
MGEGILLGVITLAGFVVLYKRLPKGIKVFLVRHPLLTDVTLAVVFYMLMGFSLTAHIACAAMTLGAMLLLEMEREPAKYQFFINLVDQAKTGYDKFLLYLQSFSNKQNVIEVSHAN